LATLGFSLHLALDFELASIVLAEPLGFVLPEAVVAVGVVDAPSGGEKISGRILVEWRVLVEDFEVSVLLIFPDPESLLRNE